MLIRACSAGLPPKLTGSDTSASAPPSVHQMVLTLERAGLIRRQPGVARSIEILLAPELLPILR